MKQLETSTGLRVESGRSGLVSGRAAALEVVAGWTTEPEVVFAFASTAQDPGETARALAERFPGARVIGCTTSGEHLMGEHTRGTLVVSGLSATGIRWGAAMVRGLADFDEARAAALVAELFADAGLVADDVDPSELFCLGFLDGMSRREEHVSALVADALGGVRLVGGSAGDDLRFQQTQVILDGVASSDAAVFLLGHAGPAAPRFDILKHQHFTSGGTQLAVTRVGEGGRRLIELDGRIAAEAYAEAIGASATEMTTDFALRHPVTFRCKGDVYVRSISRFHEDGSMDFLCALEEGMVLELGGHHDMVESLERDLTAMSGRGRPAFLLRFNCVLRALESEQRRQTDRLGAAWMRAAASCIGFDTYGEQLDGLHINQTVLAFALHPGEVGLTGSEST